MRILFINSVYMEGSTGKIIYDTAEAARKAGHSVFVLYGVGKVRDPKNASVKKISGKADYYFHNFCSRITDHTGLYSVRATRRALKAIDSFRPDLVHLHNLHGYYINYEILFEYLKSRHIPVIWTLHDCWAFTGHCTHYSQTRCLQWQNECRECGLLRRYPKCWFKGDVTGNFRRKKAAFSGVSPMVITVPSQWMADQVEKSFLKEKEIRVIHNGIDLNIFCPRESMLRERYLLTEKKVVLGVANVWNERKGLNDLLKMAGSLGADMQLVLIGLSEEQLQKIPEYVTGIPRTADREELAQWYSLADVFVNPSYEDTFSLVNLEAQACGTFVVAYDTDGMPENIMPGNGTIVPQGDVEGLKKAVFGAVERGQKADPGLIKNYDKDYVYKEYLALYENISDLH